MLANPLADARNLALTFFAPVMAPESNAGEPGKMTREVWSALPGPRLSTFADGSRLNHLAIAWQAPDGTRVNARLPGLTPSTFTGTDPIDPID